MSQLEFQHFPVNMGRLPTSWTTTSLASLKTEVRSGFPSGEHNADGTGIPHLRPMNISREGTLYRDEMKYVLPDTNPLRVQVGDVLFNNTNSPDLIGKTTAITAEGEMAFSNHMTRLRFESSAVSFRFAAHQLHFLWMSRYFRHRCVNHVNQASISGRPLAESVPFILPPLPEQHRIVEKIEELFSDLDAGVASLQRAKANLKRYRASVLKAAVEGRLTEEWREQHPQTEDGAALLDRILRERRTKWETEQLAKFKEKGKEPPKNWKSKYEEPAAPDTRELPELPEGWVWATVSQVVSQEPYSLAIGPFGSSLKVRDYRDNGVPLVFVRNIRSETFGGSSTTYVTPEKADTLSAHAVSEGDLLITKMGDPPGDCCIYPSGMPRAIITADCIKVRLHTYLTKSLLFVYAIRSEVVKRQISVRTKGVAQQKVSLGRFARVAFPLPPLAEQEQIVALVDERLSQIDSAERTIDAELIRAKRLRQAILKRAFEGQLVPQDPNDEPASVLLERIKASQQTAQPARKTKKVKSQ